MRFSIITLSIILLDQFTKNLVQRFLSEGDSVPIIKGTFHLTYFRNPGAAFNILRHQTEFFVVITIVVMGVILYFYRQLPREKILARTALALQFGGAGGNLIDRVSGGYVVDFLDFRVWPVFNIADSAIVIGVLLLSWEIIRWEERDEQVEDNR